MYLNKNCSFICTNEGSSKRCGGIGDILAGLVGTFASWDFVYGPILACLVCRNAAK
jgi:NAD(P)H-hydrate repair Nnr-like enzyme with NAD(P)H-hydrate dehydratase domain